MIKHQITALNRLLEKYNTTNPVDTAMRVELLHLKLNETYIYVHQAMETLQAVSKQYASTVVASKGKEAYRRFSTLTRKSIRIKEALADLEMLEVLQVAHCGNCGAWIDYEAHKPCERCGSIARCLESH